MVLVYKAQSQSGTNIRRRWRFYDLFDGAPGTSLYAEQNDRGTLRRDTHSCL